MAGQLHVYVQIGQDRVKHTCQLGRNTVIVAEVKNFLAGTTGVPAAEQCLSKKNDLPDGAEISLRNFKKTCVLEMVPLMSVVVVAVSGDILFTATMRSWDTFLELKLMLRQRFRYDLEMQRLVLGEKIIRGVVTLGDVCRIFEQCDTLPGLLPMVFVYMSFASMRVFETHSPAAS
jgi:hypothetical protein